MSLIFKGIYLGGGGGGSANLTTLDVTPMINYQSISPEEGYDGFSLVNVSAVNSSIDPNITASNIVNGVDILGVVGTAEAGAPKTVARYQVDENGVAAVNDQDITGMFDDITKVQTNAFLNAFYYTNVSGTVSFPNCTIASINSFTNAFCNTNISDVSFPNLTAATAAFVYTFRNCNINNVDFHSVKSLTAGVFSSTFTGAVVNFANFGSLIDASVGFPGAFQSSTINGVDFSNVKYTDSGCFSMCFYNSKGLTSINYPSLTNVGVRAFNAAFSYSDLISFDAQNISYVDINGFAQAFSNTANFTYFNVPENITIGGNDAFSSAFRNSNLLSFKLSSGLRNSYQNCFKDAFNNCQNLISVNMSAPVAYNTGSNCFINLCRNCPNLVSVDLSSVTDAYLSTVDASFMNAFANDFNLTSVNFFSYDTLSGNHFRNAFYGCSNLTTMEFPSISQLGSVPSFDNAFAYSGIQSLYFSGLYRHLPSPNNYHPLVNMLKGVNGCTVHFPASSQGWYQSHPDFVAGFGGTNTTVLFDLPNISNAFGVYYLMEENGEMGGQNIAVNASSENVNAWGAINNSTYTGWHSAVSEAPHFYTIYAPEGMKIKSISLGTRASVNITTNMPVMINVCTSNDGTNWNEVYTEYNTSITPAVVGNVNIEFKKPGYYKYYKFFFNSYNNNPSYLVTINEMTINGTRKYF